MSLSEAETPSFRSQVRMAVIWRSGSQIVGQMIAWASTFLVLRLLSPADYGLYAMAAAVLSLLTLLNGYGLANALVQRKQVSHHEIRQLFGMLILVNGALALTQFLTAPLVASYYGQPIVADILRMLSLAFLTNPFLALGYMVLAREMDFRKQAHVNLTAAILAAAVALGGAAVGLGVWALVYAPLTGFATRGFGMTIAARSFVWPSFNFRGAGAMAGFGGTVALSSLFYFFQTQSDIIIAGRAFDAYTVGLYTTSLFLAQIFVNKVVPPLNEVAFSAYARVQDDRKAVAEGFLTSVRAIMLLAIPFSLGLSVTAEPAVHILLGEKWLPAAPLLKLLSLAIPWMTLLVLFAPATNAAGKPAIAMINSAIGAALMPIAFLIGVQWGIVGLAIGWVVVYPLMTIITAANSIAIIGISMRQLLAALLPPVLAGIGMAASVMALDHFVPLQSQLLRLIMLVTIGGTIYLGWVAIFARDRLTELISLIRDR